jgi:hypothetical protein
VFCGRAFAHPMSSACVTFGSPLNSSKHIIAQLLSHVQRSLMLGFQLSASLSTNLGYEWEGLQRQRVSA